MAGPSYRPAIFFRYITGRFGRTAEVAHSPTLHALTLFPVGQEFGHSAHVEGVAATGC